MAMKKFNTTGPCFPDEHYMLPPLDRLPGVREFVTGDNYFVIHVPRQTGKTIALQALVGEINGKGGMFALYCTLESLQDERDVDKANAAIRGLIVDNAVSSAAFPSGGESALAAPSIGGPRLAVRTALRRLCAAVGRPVVVFFDAVDCLVGEVLISFLRQVRDGYVNRKMASFPKSIALVGMVDVRNYKAQIRPDGQSLGQASPFNIISDDLLIPNFKEEDVGVLYGQHTAETGQRFEDNVSVNDDDYRYVVDLGLLRVDRGALVPSNPMYAEIIGRYLSRDEQERMIRKVPETPWAKDDGLDMPGPMAAFQQFWRENAGADRDIMGYREAVPHLVLMAFLQRVTNGGGRINREMALWSGRLDLCVEFRGGRYAIEVKTSENFEGEKSYAQCAKHLDALGLAEGWMPVFDKSTTKPWEDKIYSRDETVDGKSIHVIGL